MGWFSIVQNWWKRFFSKRTSNAYHPPQEGTPAVEISRTPGLKCPECSTKMVVSIQNLVNLDPLICPGCGLELTIDVENSQSALDSLRKLQSGLQEAAQAKRNSQIGYQ